MSKHAFLMMLAMVLLLGASGCCGRRAFLCGNNVCGGAGCDDCDGGSCDSCGTCGPGLFGGPGIVRRPILGGRLACGGGCGSSCSDCDGGDCGGGDCGGGGSCNSCCHPLLGPLGCMFRDWGGWGCGWGWWRCGGCAGCGERYRGDYASDPPSCCEPCDRCGNHIGNGFIARNLRPHGGPSWGGENYGYGHHGYDGEVIEGETVYEGETVPSARRSTTHQANSRVRSSAPPRPTTTARTQGPTTYSSAAPRTANSNNRSAGSHSTGTTRTRPASVVKRSANSWRGEESDPDLR